MTTVIVCHSGHMIRSSSYWVLIMTRDRELSWEDGLSTGRAQWVCCQHRNICRPWTHMWQMGIKVHHICCHTYALRGWHDVKEEANKQTDIQILPPLFFPQPFMTFITNGCVNIIFSVLLHMIKWRQSSSSSPLLALLWGGRKYTLNGPKVLNHGMV